MPKVGIWNGNDLWPICGARIAIVAVQFCLPCGSYRRAVANSGAQQAKAKAAHFVTLTGFPLLNIEQSGPDCETRFRPFNIYEDKGHFVTLVTFNGFKELLAQAKAEKVSGCIGKLHIDNGGNVGTPTVCGDTGSANLHMQDANASAIIVSSLTSYEVRKDIKACAHEGGETSAQNGQSSEGENAASRTGAVNQGAEIHPVTSTCAGKTSAIHCTPKPQVDND